MAHRNSWFTELNSMVDLSMAICNNQMVVIYSCYQRWIKNRRFFGDVVGQDVRCLTL